MVEEGSLTPGAPFDALPRRQGSVAECCTQSSFVPKVSRQLVHNTKHRSAFFRFFVHSIQPVKFFLADQAHPDKFFFLESK